MKNFVALFFLLSLPFLAFAQIQLVPNETTFEVRSIVITPVELVPAQTTFEVRSIVITPVEPTSDYTSTSQYIALRGDIEYLIISWNASYLGGFEKDIGVLCYLNCPNLTTEDIEISCAGIQNCSYVGPPGYRSCSIQNPSYFYNKQNNVACKFYDPTNPDILFVDTATGKPYLERNFSTINFTLDISVGKISVGKPFRLHIKVKNLGLFKNSFGTSIRTFQPNIIISRADSLTDEIYYGEVAATFPSITFLIEQKAIFKVLVNATKDKFVCFNDEDCSHFNENGIIGVCERNTCHKEIELSIEAGKVSLKDFNLIQLIIFLPLTLIFYALIEKKINLSLG